MAIETNDNIEEAKIVDPVAEEKAGEESDDLMNRLEKRTQHKEPTKEQIVWDFTKVEEESEPEEEEESEPETKTKKTEKPKLTKEMKMASARMAVGALDLTQRSIFGPLINRKYKKKFNPDEIKKLDETNIIDADKTQLEDEELILRNKFDRLMAIRDRKQNDVPFKPTETKDMEQLLYNYMDVKNTDLPPEVMLTIGFMNVLGKRAIDLFTE